MPFPRSAQIKGGQHPASELQKAIALHNILKNQPWKHSTGATSQKGKFYSSMNRQNGWQRCIESTDKNYEESCNQLAEIQRRVKAIAKLHSKKEEICGATVQIKISVATTGRTGQVDEVEISVYRVKLNASLTIEGLNAETEAAKPIAEAKFNEAITSIKQILDSYSYE
jgi:hypothetical protein